MKPKYIPRLEDARVVCNAVAGRDEANLHDVDLCKSSLVKCKASGLKKPEATRLEVNDVNVREVHERPYQI